MQAGRASQGVCLGGAQQAVDLPSLAEALQPGVSIPGITGQWEALGQEIVAYDQAPTWGELAGCLEEKLARIKRMGKRLDGVGCAGRAKGRQLVKISLDKAATLLQVELLRSRAGVINLDAAVADADQTKM
jgi:hypothetical protein